MIGCAGKANPIDHFRGRIRAVRVSKGERYDADFTPASTFTADPPEAPSRAVLIFDGAHVEGDRVTDLSGGGHHGHVERIGDPLSARVRH